MHDFLSLNPAFPPPSRPITPSTQGFRAQLHSLIQAHGLTQKQLADGLGVCQATIHKWLNGSMPSGLHLTRLASFFERHPADLIEDHPSAQLHGFPERLRKLMISRRLTQVVLATKLGVAQSRVSHWLNGKALPQPRSARALADALQVNVTWLLQGTAA